MTAQTPSSNGKGNSNWVHALAIGSLTGIEIAVLEVGIKDSQVILRIAIAIAGLGGYLASKMNQ